MRWPMRLSCLLMMLSLSSACGDDGDTTSNNPDAGGARDATIGQPDAAVGQPDAGSDFLLSLDLNNEAPYIPPPCYVDTKDEDDRVRNTCFACHSEGRKPDFVITTNRQKNYQFIPQRVAENPWSNPLSDRQAMADAIPDSEIQTYVRESNYFDSQGNIILADKLANLPSGWDFDKDGAWDGYTPDAFFNFDNQGFDKAANGDFTGWRALAYYPFPTTHWPANGAIGDVLLRLPEPFRTSNGTLDVEVYRLNFAILEALHKRENVAIQETNENTYGVDLDQDGTLGTATEIVYAEEDMSYVGDAKTRLEADEVKLATGLFPEGTELLCTVRYLDVGDQDEIKMAARFKEVRYMVKSEWLTPEQLDAIAKSDAQESVAPNDWVKTLEGNLEEGVSNRVGWTMQGFIEDADGALRPQTFEETGYCIGCHGGLGATTDSVFSFSRKLDSDAFQEGWYHHDQKGLTGITEPKVTYDFGDEVHYEYSFYLLYAGAGDDLRDNEEIKDAFIDANGDLDLEAAMALHDDISLLLYPSPERAWRLNKAYKIIAERQSYRLGRDAVLGKVDTLFDEITEDIDLTGVNTAVSLVDGPSDFRPAVDVEIDDNPVDAALRQEISGITDFGGIDGVTYSINWDGEILQSKYSLDVEGFYFPFPLREPLPVRFVVPIGSSSGCYNCHRLEAPMPAGEPVIEGITLPDTPNNEPELALTQLTTDEGADTGAVWSPDGNHIAWVSDRSGSFQIWVMDADGGNQTQITGGGDLIYAQPLFSPDSTRLVYWGYNENTGQSYILNNAVDGTDEIEVVSASQRLDRPSFSPDGNYIAYGIETVDTSWDIHVAANDGTADYRVTSREGSETTAIWDPTATTSPLRLTYKDCAAGEYPLCTQNFLTFDDENFETPDVHTWDDTPPDHVQNGPHSIQAYDWSPDGEYLAYTAELVNNASGKDRVSYMVVVDDIELLPLSSTEPVDTGLCENNPVFPTQGVTLGDRGPVFSPDGTMVAYWAWDQNYRATLWLADADGSNARQLTRFGFDMYPRWNDDSTKLVFESNRSGNTDIWVVDVE